jgi:hypothetical protein
VNVLAAILVASTSLNITVWPGGQGKPGKKTYTLRCAPAAGTLPHRDAACTKLAGMTHPFTPTRKDVVCTDIYGGPAEARVTGRLRGYSVGAHFTRQNGCEIGRWNRVRFLFAGAGSAANSR